MQNQNYQREMQQFMINQGNNYWQTGANNQNQNVQNFTQQNPGYFQQQNQRQGRQISPLGSGRQSNVRKSLELLQKSQERDQQKAQFEQWQQMQQMQQQQQQQQLLLQNQPQYQIQNQNQQLFQTSSPQRQAYQVTSPQQQYFEQPQVVKIDATQMRPQTQMSTLQHFATLVEGIDQRHQKASSQLDHYSPSKPIPQNNSSILQQPNLSQQTMIFANPGSQNNSLGYWANSLQASDSKQNQTGQFIENFDQKQQQFQAMQQQIQMQQKQLQQEMDDVPLNKKPKEFEAVLEENLGSKSTTSFYKNDDSVISGDSKQSGKREFLKRKSTRQESVSSRTKTYKYYSDNFEKKEKGGQRKDKEKNNKEEEKKFRKSSTSISRQNFHSNNLNNDIKNMVRDRDESPLIDTELSKMSEEVSQHAIKTSSQPDDGIDVKTNKRRQISQREEKPKKKPFLQRGQGKAGGKQGFIQQVKPEETTPKRKTTPNRKSPNKYWASSATESPSMIKKAGESPKRRKKSPSKTRSVKRTSILTGDQTLTSMQEFVRLENQAKAEADQDTFQQVLENSRIDKQDETPSELVVSQSNFVSKIPQASQPIQQNAFQALIKRKTAEIPEKEKSTSRFEDSQFVFQGDLLETVNSKCEDTLEQQEEEEKNPYLLVGQESKQSSQQNPFNEYLTSYNKDIMNSQRFPSITEVGGAFEAKNALQRPFAKVFSSDEPLEFGEQPGEEGVSSSQRKCSTEQVSQKSFGEENSLSHQLSKPSINQNLIVSNQPSQNEKRRIFDYSDEEEEEPESPKNHKHSILEDIDRGTPSKDQIGVIEKSPLKSDVVNRYFGLGKKKNKKEEKPKVDLEEEHELMCNGCKKPVSQAQIQKSGFVHMAALKESSFQILQQKAKDLELALQSCYNEQERCKKKVQETERAQKQYKQQQKEFEALKQNNFNELDKMKEAEWAKLNKEKKAMEKRQKTLQNLGQTNQKDRQDTDSVKQELEKLKKEFASKEAKYKLEKQRTAEEIKKLQAINSDLQTEVKYLESMQYGGGGTSIATSGYNPKAQRTTVDSDPSKPRYNF